MAQGLWVSRFWVYGLRTSLVAIFAILAIIFVIVFIKLAKLLSKRVLGSGLVLGFRVVQR